MEDDLSYSYVPSEQYYARDYDPIEKDNQGRIIDSKTRQYPHTLSNGYLVEFNQKPYAYQYADVTCERYSDILISENRVPKHFSMTKEQYKVYKKNLQQQAKTTYDRLHHEAEISIMNRRNNEFLYDPSENENENEETSNRTNEHASPALSANSRQRDVDDDTDVDFQLESSLEENSSSDEEVNEQEVGEPYVSIKNVDGNNSPAESSDEDSIIKHVKNRNV